jgi:hypothetical protein
MKNHENRLRGRVGALLCCCGMLMGGFTAFAADNAELISVSVPTNTQMLPGAMFMQTWTLQNNGTTTWSPGESGYILKLVGLDSLGAIPLCTNTDYTRYRPIAIIGSGTSVAPGKQATFSLNFIAPLAAGPVSDAFQLYNSNGVAFGPQVPVQIVVAAGASTNLYDRARAVSYANNYDGYVVSDGYFWTDGSDYYYFGVGAPVPTNYLGDDCAHFCSCCMGRQPNDPGGGLYIRSRVPPTYGEPGAADIVNICLIGAGYAKEVFSLTNMAPGDIIGWNWEGDTNIEDLDHVTLYVGNGMVASHAVSALDVSATTFFQDGTPDWVWHLVHIIDNPTILQSPQVSSHGAFTFTVSGSAGDVYAIQSSTNLLNWNTVGTISNVTGSVDIIVGTSPVTNGGYYYRAAIIP